MKDLPITDNHIHVDPVNGDGPWKWLRNSRRQEVR